MKQNICIKCGLPVEEKEDLSFLIADMENKPAIIMMLYPQHIKCSPSRAQYILDLNVYDDRPEYNKLLMDIDFVLEQEEKWTNAYRKFMEKYK